MYATLIYDCLINAIRLFRQSQRQRCIIVIIGIGDGADRGTRHEGSSRLLAPDLSAFA